MKNQEIKQEVILRKEENIGIITLNRPDRLNAINDDVIQLLMSFLNEVTADEQIKVVILTGRGNQAFCSGADLKDPKIGNTDQYSKYLKTYYQPVVKMIGDMKIPVLAAINGAVVGAGIGFALACDYLIMSREAFFYPAFSKIGLVPDSGVMTYLVRRLGKYRAFEIASLAKKISSEEALNWGLVNKVTNYEDLMATAKEVARELSIMPTIAVGLIKYMANRAEEMSLSEAFEMESDFQEIAAGTKDHLEGVRAFIEKREPHFKGQ